jgi:hypothetical protein
MIGALDRNGSRGMMTVEGGTDAVGFESFIEDVPIPTLNRGDIVVLDHVGAHKPEHIRVQELGTMETLMRILAERSGEQLVYSTLDEEPGKAIGFAYTSAVRSPGFAKPRQVVLTARLFLEPLARTWPREHGSPRCSGGGLRTTSRGSPRR